MHKIIVIRVHIKIVIVCILIFEDHLSMKIKNFPEFEVR